MGADLAVAAPAATSLARVRSPSLPGVPAELLPLRHGHAFITHGLSSEDERFQHGHRHLNGKDANDHRSDENSNGV